jgi:hypothetical protein
LDYSRHKTRIFDKDKIELVNLYVVISRYIGARLELGKMCQATSQKIAVNIQGVVTLH